MNHPVLFDASRPVVYERVQVAIRLLLAIVLGTIGAPLGGILGVAYLVLPVVAAIVVTDRGGERYLREVAPIVESALRWLLSLVAYLAFVTDRIPTITPSAEVRFAVVRTGLPTPGSALLRLLAGIPSAIVLVLLAIVAGVLGIVAFVTVLVSRTVPRGIFDFERAWVRLLARLLAYEASMYEGPPPFELDLADAPTPVSGV